MVVVGVGVVVFVVVVAVDCDHRWSHFPRSRPFRLKIQSVVAN